MLNRREFTMLLGAAAARGQTQAPKPELEWTDARKLTVEGLGFKDLKSPYDRLPTRAEGVVRPVVWDLSRESAGVAVRFRSNATAIHARWRVSKERLTIPTAPAVAVSGLDLYAKTPAGKWRWLGIGRPTKFPENVEPLISSMNAGEREYFLYLPMGNGTASLEIGVPKGSSVSPGEKRAAGLKPIVFYGTSITHGYCASRSGMTHVSILGRMFNREVINLGFSGNGKMEPEVTKFVAELDAAAFVLDCLPNMNAQEVTERAEPCVKQLRAAHPETPILLVEDRNYQDDFAVVSRRERNQTNHVALQAAYARMKAAKIPHLHYLKADDLLGDDGEGTIDGSHPTDLGFMRQAAEFAKVLKPMLKG